MACKSKTCDSSTNSSESINVKPSFTVKPLRQKAAAEHETVGDAMAGIKKHATGFTDMYAAYNELRALARPLNGLLPTDKIPDGLKINSVKISYEVAGEDREAAIQSVETVGELAPLIATALRRFIDEIRAELNMLDASTSAVQAAISAYIAQETSAEKNTVENTETVTDSN